VTFLHSVAEGPSSSSYGVEVAHLAGVPSTVVDRARRLVEAGGTADAGETDAVGDEGSNTNPGQQTDHTHPKDHESPQDGTLAAYVDGIENGHRADGDGSDDADPNVAVARDDADPNVDVAREVADDLRETDLVETTPLEALNLLSELKRRLE
jgi:DNA mismatch repair protein MutS